MQEEDEENQVNKNPRTQDDVREAMGHREDTVEWSEMMESLMQDEQQALPAEGQPRAVQELTKSGDGSSVNIYYKTYLISTTATDFFDLVCGPLPPNLQVLGIGARLFIRPQRNWVH